jgi:hypothetical protein
MMKPQQGYGMKRIVKLESLLLFSFLDYCKF